jgi:phage I-like protein
MTILEEKLDSLGEVTLSESNEPPTEIRLFVLGDNPTTKGNFVLDVAGGAQVLDGFARGGLGTLPFDLGHGMLAGAMAHPDHQKARGWFVPEMRLDGLWASNIEWTPSTRASLAAKEFRFHSPAIRFEEKTRRIVGLTNVALTNLPATLGQKPLVLDSGDTETEENMTVLFEKLGAADEPEALSALGGLLALRDGLVALGCADLSSVQALVTERDTLKTEKEAALAAQLTAQKAGLLSAVPPAHRGFAETLSVEQLGAYVATLPKLETRVEEKSDGTKSVQLSAEEKDAAQALGLSDEAFLAAKTADGVK